VLLPKTISVYETSADEINTLALNKPFRNQKAFDFGFIQSGYIKVYSQLKTFSIVMAKFLQSDKSAGGLV